MFSFNQVLFGMILVGIILAGLYAGYSIEDDKNIGSKWMKNPVNLLIAGVVIFLCLAVYELLIGDQRGYYIGLMLMGICFSLYMFRYSRKKKKN
ncbi:MAG: hypothetical protein HUJ54_10940 [Erysipelotrichaceae bacterium]|nr:hypothetical protein [Erysipelotrichaceae bacterium]